jgi:CRP-like cAMP-binding protein
MQELIDNITKLVGEKPPKLEIVLAAFKEVIVTKNEYFQREGQICNKVYFVKSGWVQVLQTDNNLNEKTVDLLLPGEWFSDLDSFTQETPAKTYFKSGEKTELLFISRNSFQQLMQEVPSFVAAYLKILEEKYRESIERIVALNTMNAKEKIEWLYHNKPALFEIVPDNMIAAYLGISKETFCRKKQKLT